MISRRFAGLYANISTNRTMPKNKTAKKSSIPTETTQIQGPVRENKNGCFTIHIQAKPGAQQNNITDIGKESIGIQIAAPPVDGEANTELIKYLSKVLSVRKSDLSLQTGSKSRSKSISITSASLSKDQILDILKSHLEER
ncbi:UPF0235 protein C15orf40 homolog [Liolophura sinensis]|uniref:UPF0235 protein C15orf40 homolog n=1 Tax=Liolophura sinensis TaxID=3198878 RepID=UPI00315951DB